MEPTTKPNCEPTIHTDGSVSYWDVYRQQWRRSPVEAIPDAVLASMPERDRAAIIKHETAAALAATTVIAIDYEHNSDQWWQAARSRADVPACIRDVVLGRANYAHASQQDADAAMQWARSVDGWDDAAAPLIDVGGDDAN